MKKLTTLLQRMGALMLLFLGCSSVNSAWAQSTPIDLSQGNYEEGFENGIGQWTITKYASLETGINQYLNDDPEPKGDYHFQFSSLPGDLPSIDRATKTAPQYLISPEFNCEQAIQISFWYRNFNVEYEDGVLYRESFQVGYSTTTKEVDAFFWGDELYAEDIEWHDYTANFPIGTKYIAVKYTSDKQHDLYLDDFEFSVFGGCPKPMAPVEDYVTHNAFAVNWAGEHDSYDVNYSEFVTYSFDVANDLEGWTTNNSNDYGWQWGDEGREGSAGKLYSMSFNNDAGSLLPDNYLISPEIRLGGSISFYVKESDDAEYAFVHEHFKVMVSNNSASVEDFVAASSDLYATNGDGWVKFIVDLSSYQGNGYVAIHHLYDSDKTQLEIDDITITYPATTINTLTEPSCTINGLEEETNYVIRVKGYANEDESDWSAPLQITTHPEGTTTKHIAACQGTAGYYLIASPFDAQNPVNVGMITDDLGGAGTPETSTYDFYWFEQNQADEWRNYRQIVSTTLNTGMGYLYANKNDVDLKFEGEPNTVGLVSLCRDENASFKGWNLVGNPFAETAYIQDGRDFFVMNDEGSEIVPANRTNIKPMEGIFVVATENDEEMMFTTEAPAKNAEQLVINVSRNRGVVVDRAILRFGEGLLIPKFQRNPNNTKLYFAEGNQEYAVMRTADESERPVNFKAQSNGNYTISVEPTNVEMDYLHLIDNMTGADVDLLQTPSYTFDARTTDYASRFRLVFATTDAEEDSASAGSAAFAFNSNGSWIILNDGNATLQVVDVMGRLVSSETINGNAEISLNQPAGIYMLRLVNGSDVKVQKVVVR